MIRSGTKHDETKARTSLIKRGKYFIPPQRGDSDFKVLFRQLASAGAGRPVDANGLAQGPWTPELLAEAISQIDANRSGIELRTVQLWFQDNEKGISSDNIRWLARIFGCGDPVATSDWQVELSASQARLTLKRRQRRTSPASTVQALRAAEPLVTVDNDTDLPAEPAPPRLQRKPAGTFNLAQKSESIFGHGSFLDLPASVFAGAVTLGFVSIFLGIHSVLYTREDGVLKQVGFLWAPNWSLLFTALMPLFFAFAVELLSYWKSEGRPQLLAAGGGGGADNNAGWTRKVEASSYTYWVSLLVCVGFAGVFQWISVRLIPLLNDSDDYAIDWGSIGISHPDVISVPQAAAFTGVAYLYMCLCFYLFFVGLILLYTLAHDYWEIARVAGSPFNGDPLPVANEVGDRIMRAIFRCTVLGLLIAICMKLQSSYLTTRSENILRWLADDSLSVLFERTEATPVANYNAPNQYTSLLTAITTSVVFVYAFSRLGGILGLGAPLVKMAATVLFLAVGFLMIASFNGFSILLAVTVLLAVYGLFDPRFGARRLSKSRHGRNVS